MSGARAFADASLARVAAVHLLRRLVVGLAMRAAVLPMRWEAEIVSFVIPVASLASAEILPE